MTISTDRTKAFHRLHESGCFVIPNPWNPGSARLLVQMDQYPLSSFCPHGRPVFTKRRFTEIDREFGRIV